MGRMATIMEACTYSTTDDAAPFSLTAFGVNGPTLRFCCRTAYSPRSWEKRYEKRRHMLVIAVMPPVCR
jgi:hypothetical protein